MQRAGGALEATLVKRVVHHAHDITITNWLAAVGALVERWTHANAHAHGYIPCHGHAHDRVLLLQLRRLRCVRCC